MGLDMYLNAKRYIWSSESDIKQKVSSDFDLPEGIQVEGVSAEVAYWRKANAIHRWFVNEVQGGVDDCESYEFTRKKLRELIDVCRMVKENPQWAPALLPTQSGFFFGETEYGDWYFRYIDETIVMIERALTLPESWVFEYRSSW